MENTTSLKYILSVIRKYFNFRLLLFICLFLFASSLFSQEVGSIKKGNHSIELLKLNNRYSMVYSDINSNKVIVENTIHFSIKESVYEIIMNGFNSNVDHQIILQTSNDTIVKLEYRAIKGEKMLKIKQNNLAVNTFGASIYFTKSEMQTLFGNIL